MVSFARMDKIEFEESWDGNVVGVSDDTVPFTYASCGSGLSLIKPLELELVLLFVGAAL